VLYPGGQDATAPALERYRRALVLIAGHSPAEAVPLLRGLLRQYPDITLYHTALGQALLEAGDIEASLRVLQDAVRLFPRNVPVTTRLAETLVRNGEARRAHQLLLDLFNNVPPTPAQARYIAQVANTAGDTGDAYYYMSEHYVMSGELTLAIDQLRLALAVPNLSTVQRQRFQARIDELSEYLPKGRRERQIPAQTGSRDGGSAG
jgi:predicted Zn-dependent protease